jgi:hypothetical protein
MLQLGRMDMRRKMESAIPQNALQCSGLSQAPTLPTATFPEYDKCNHCNLTAMYERIHCIPTLHQTSREKESFCMQLQCNGKLTMADRYELGHSGSWCLVDGCVGYTEAGRY